MEFHEIQNWLKEADPQRLERLWQEADATRRRHVGEDVHLRGLIEFSNHCARSCAYCGLRAENHQLERYRMTAGEILECAHQAVDFGYGTVVLQSGEDYGMDAGWMARVIARIKRETPLAVTLSLGERSEEELHMWRLAGADRYLLRFETSSQILFQQIHPPLSSDSPGRVELLRLLRDMGYETGSGVMVGIPGQTWNDLTHDLLLFRQLDLDMIGIGPFLPHPHTPLGARTVSLNNPERVPNSEETVLKAVALTRLLCPKTNIPATTALATVNRTKGRELALARGANIVMPNLTPLRYRLLYEIYPGKACIQETATECQKCLEARIRRIGRTIGIGRGDSPNLLERTVATGERP